MDHLSSRGHARRVQEEASKAGAAGADADAAGGGEVAALVESAASGQGPASGGGAAPLAKQLQPRQPPKTYIGPDASAADYVNQVWIGACFFLAAPPVKEFWT